MDVDEILRYQLYPGRQSRKGRERKGGGYWFIMVDRIVKEEGGRRERKTDRQAYRHTHAHRSRSYMSRVEFWGRRDRNSYNLI